MSPDLVVFKYPIPMPDQEGIATVTLPVGATICSVGVQKGHPMLWALVDSGQEHIYQQRLWVLATGQSVNPFSGTPGACLGRLETPVETEHTAITLVYHVFLA